MLSSTRSIWLFPIISSLFLLLVYTAIKANFNRTIQVFLLFFVGFVGTLNLASYLRSTALKLGAENIDETIQFLEKYKPRFLKLRMSLLQFICMIVAGFVTYMYIRTKGWVYNNVLAISFTIYFLNKMLVTNFQNSIIYLVGMLIYDIFWVFGSDVMVTVATQLDLPIKLLFPRQTNALTGATTFYMIGIGDIALPGIFVGKLIYLSYANE